MEPFILTNDAMGTPTPILPSPSSSIAILLEAGQSRLVTAPAGARVVLFSASIPFWARIGAAATVPAADILDGSAPELSPVARTLGKATTVGLAAVSAGTVNLVFFH